MDNFSVCLSLPISCLCYCLEKSWYFYLDGNSEIGAHVRSNLCYLTCFRHLISSRAVTNRFFSPKRPLYLYACAKRSELPSNISTIGKVGLFCGSLFMYSVYLIPNKTKLFLMFYKGWWSGSVFFKIVGSGLDKLSYDAISGYKF